jgi:hypothetical protein
MPVIAQRGFILPFKDYDADQRRLIAWLAARNVRVRHAIAEILNWDFVGYVLNGSLTPTNDCS